MASCPNCKAIFQGGRCPLCVPGPAAGTRARVAPYPSSSAVGASRPPAPRAPEFGSAKLVGDAAPIAGIPLSRIGSAAVYLIAGVTVLVLSGRSGIPTGWAVLIGLFLIGYCVKILFTATSYVISSGVFVVATIGVVLMFSR